MKYTTPKELLDSGLLFEINRRVLHPLGLALAVEVTTEGEVALSNEIWDNRDDPEGIAFAPETFLEGEAKYNLYMSNKKTADAISSRKKTLGYIVQTKAAMVEAGEIEE